MTTDVADVFTRFSAGNLRHWRCPRLSSNTGEEAAGGVAVRITASFSFAIGEVEGADVGHVRSRLRVSLAHFGSLIVDATAVVPHGSPLQTTLSEAFLPFSRFWVKNSLTLSKVVL